eukprot:TRINITY_DN6229_c0_g1_i1.p1 TRINITY_DN6229_c0_g1~~TRINITY_DN6229_c0_g1_i1.p1  ORF type:complete len:679 (+),score=229.91 TRINITY_DN6229_c0_g1_i1:20-2056(+)
MPLTIDEVIASCEKKNEMWVDPDFPHENRSVGKPVSGGVVWRRAAELGIDALFSSSSAPAADSQKTTLEGDLNAIRPNDIIQGGLGDCYFLSSLSCIAEFPQRIATMFRKNKENKWGVYCVTIHIDGEETDIIVDDAFPCSVETKQLLFSKNKDRELWVLLLEKAYAKYHRSYRSIESGTPSEALADLTGAPVNVFRTADTSTKKLWKIISQSDENKEIMCCGCPDFPQNDLEKEVGLIEGHAYGLLRAYETPSGAHLVQLRNPWGKVEWKGAWSDHDDKWTPEIKSAVGLESKDDGLFWMELSDFEKYFDELTVCRYSESKLFSHHEFSLESQKSCFEVTVPEEKSGECYITLHHKRYENERMACRFCVLSEKGVPIGGSDESFNPSPALSSSSFQLSSGTYKILLEVFPDEVKKLPKKCNFSVYAPFVCSIKKLEGKVDLPFILPEFAKKYGLCSECNLPLGGSSFSMNGKKMHANCFVCNSCKEKLSSFVALLDEKMYCKKCSLLPESARGEKKNSPPLSSKSTSAAASSSSASASPKSVPSTKSSATATEVKTKASSASGSTTGKPANTTTPSKSASTTAGAKSPASSSSSPTKAAAKTPVKPSTSTSSPAKSPVASTSATAGRTPTGAATKSSIASVIKVALPKSGSKESPQKTSQPKSSVVLVQEEENVVKK